MMLVSFVYCKFILSLVYIGILMEWGVMNNCMHE